jgi:hypothetical protein
MIVTQAISKRSDTLALNVAHGRSIMDRLSAVTLDALGLLNLMGRMNDG